MATFGDTVKVPEANKMVESLRAQLDSLIQKADELEGRIVKLRYVTLGGIADDETTDPFYKAGGTD